MPPRSRAPRADAAANRERILAAARVALADPSAEVSMAAIARGSGVSSATLYRHFASRRDLLEVLYLEEVDAVCAAAARQPGNEQAQLASWLLAFFRFVMSKRHVAVELLEHTDEHDHVFLSSRERVVAAGRPLLQAAQRAGAVHDRLSLDQILDLVVAVAEIAGPEEYVKPILDTALSGLGP